MKSALALLWDEYNFRGKLYKKNNGVSLHKDPQQMRDMITYYERRRKRDEIYPWKPTVVQSVLLADETFEGIGDGPVGRFYLSDEFPIEVEIPPE